ncbi:MAG TPA: hypothetical protein VMY42_03890 [Thermoguttaceae bacterium]|nr:hypothetical protein [Thermoguttaceae bacterium]
MPRLRRLGLELLEDRRLLSAAGQQTIELFNVSPALFVENQGQWPDESVRYAFNGSGATVLHTDAGPVFQLFSRVRETHQQDPWEDDADPIGALHAHDEDPLGALHAPYEATQFSVTFDGAERVEPVGLDRAETVFNYYLGEQSNWRSNVPGYATVAYPGLYDGIDLLTFGRRDSLQYEFHVAPGADRRAIRISYKGNDRLWLDDAGAKHVQPAFLPFSLGEGTAWGEFVDDAPYVYQVTDGREVEVASRFVLIEDSSYSFELLGPYDPTQTLVIDPDLAWSTYLGGSDSDIGRLIGVPFLKCAASGLQECLARGGAIR